MHARLRRLLPALILTSLAACGGGGEEAPAAAEGSAGVRVKPGTLIELPGVNLLLVVIDTLRADYTSPYGRTIATRSLQLLADQGVVFETALTPVPMTQPAHSSLFTGNYPGRHGVRDNVSYSLSGEAVTLAELLGAAGYQTGAIVASRIMARHSGLDQGFESYDDHFGSELLNSAAPIVERRAREVSDAALAWLATRDRARPFALFLHFFDPHFPHDPPQAMRALYPGDPLAGEVVHVDRNIGAVLAQIEAEGLLDQTLVVVLSDHGESLDEHGELEHGLFLYDSAVRVPLIMRLPAGRGPQKLRVKTPVSLIDVMPTVLGLLGIEAPPMDGVDLRPLLSEGTIAARPLFGETQYPLFYRWSPSFSVRADGSKYILSPRDELYALAEDPGELRNRVGDDAEQAARLRGTLEQQLARWSGSEGTAEQATSLSLQELAALGYGGGAAVDESQSGPLPDTKDQVELYAKLSRAMGLMGAQHWDAARALFEEVLARDPDNPSALLNLGSIELSTGRPAEAEKHLRACLAVAPDNRQAKATLAMTYFRTQRFEESETLFREILAEAPRSAEPRYFLGQILAQRGELDEALACFEQVQRELPNMPGLNESLAATRRALEAR